jgi:hypothetical protein
VRGASRECNRENQDRQVREKSFHSR